MDINSDHLYLVSYLLYICLDNYNSGNFPKDLMVIHVILFHIDSVCG